MEDVVLDGSNLTVAPGTTGKSAVLLLLDIEIVEGKITSVNPAGDYHFMDCSPRIPGLLTTYFRAKHDRDLYPNWPEMGEPS